MNEQNVLREICIWALVGIAAGFILTSFLSKEAPLWLLIPGVVFLALSWVARYAIPKKEDIVKDGESEYRESE